MAKENLKLLWQNGFLHGGDYNPDQWRWRPGTLDEDIEMMKAAHVNVVSMGMFSWSAIEPQEGVYDFSWLDEAIDKLYDNGILVFLSTPSGARPAWLAKKYPEVLRTDKFQVKQVFGERHNHCFTSPIYRAKVKEINQKLAERYKDHPGVVLWHISNEYEGECHCNLCQEAFREWLKNKYKDLDALNRAWWTGFWGHTFTEWDEIHSPTPIGDWSLDGLNLDWRRFVTDQTVDFYRMEVEAVREITPDRPVTTNFHDFPNPSEGLNYWKFAPYLDIVSWDNYPYWHNETNSDAVEGARRDFIHDINRSLLGKPFLLLESCPGATNWQEVSRLPKPGVIALQSMQAVAHGADSVQYFQIRKSLGASEKFHGALIDHYPSKDVRVFKEIQGLGEDLSKLDELIGANVDAKVAIIYDWENRWAIDNIQGLNENRKEYFKMCINHYFPLWSKGIGVDAIDMEQDLDKYDVLIAPLLYMVSEDLAERIKEFVARGGTFITGPFTGVVDEDQLAYMNGRPGALREIAGIWAEETDSLYDSQFNKIVKAGEGKSYKAKWFSDLLHLEGAEALYEYGEEFYAGSPAVTVNSYGEGKVYYFATVMEQDFYDDFYKEFINENMESLAIELPDGVGASVRENSEYKFIFIANHNNGEVEFNLAEDAYDVLAEQELAKGTSIEMPAYSYKVYRVKK